MTTSKCTFYKKRNLSWVLSTSGFLMVKNLRTSEVFALKDVYMKVWVTMGENATLREISKRSGLSLAQTKVITDELTLRKLLIRYIPESKIHQSHLL